MTAVILDFMNTSVCVCNYTGVWTHGQKKRVMKRKVVQQIFSLAKVKVAADGLTIYEKVSFTFCALFVWTKSKLCSVTIVN